MCVCACVYRPDTRAIQAGASILVWSLCCLVHSPVQRTDTHTDTKSHTGAHKFGRTHADTCTLSLNNTAVVLETLTKVSVDASKQRNERTEKNQSTRQLTPVQNTGTHSANQFGCCVWDDMCLGGNDGGDDTFSWVFLTTAAGIKRFLLGFFLFSGYQLQFETTAMSWKWKYCHQVISSMENKFKTSIFSGIVSLLFFPPFFFTAIGLSDNVSATAPQNLGLKTWQWPDLKLPEQTGLFQSAEEGGKVTESMQCKAFMHAPTRNSSAHSKHVLSLRAFLLLCSFWI